jgi:Mg2+/Co2+ transporter CorB
LHVKDLLSVISHKKTINIEKILVKPWFIPKTTLVKSQLVEFRIRKKHFALVVDEYGVIQGMVTLEDILEEIVGEITDEHDIAENHVKKNKDGSYMIDGMFTVRDLNRELEWKLPDDKANTVAGLIINELERIPDVGEHFNFYDTKFEIIEKNGSQITKIKLHLIPLN